MNIEEIPDDELLHVMGWRHSLRLGNRLRAYDACREMIRRREVALGLRTEDVGEKLKHYWRDDNARQANDFQVFA